MPIRSLDQLSLSRDQTAYNQTIIEEKPVRIDRRHQTQDSLSNQSIRSTKISRSLTKLFKFNVLLGINPPPSNI